MTFCKPADWWHEYARVSPVNAQTWWPIFNIQIFSLCRAWSFCKPADWICKGFTCQGSKLEHGLPSHDHNHCCVIILSLFHCWVIFLPQSLLCYNPLTFQQLKLFPWICSCVKILFAHFSTDCLDLVRVSDCAITNGSCCATPLSCPG